MAMRFCFAFWYNFLTCLYPLSLPSALCRLYVARSIATLSACAVFVPVLWYSWRAETNAARFCDDHSGSYAMLGLYARPNRKTFPLLSPPLFAATVPFFFCVCFFLSGGDGSQSCAAGRASSCVPALAARAPLRAPLILLA